MAEGKPRGLFQNPWFCYGDKMKNSASQSPTSSVEDNSSVVSNGSSICSSDTQDDDASSSSNSGGALDDLSEIMTHLPIKRGLSKFYEGKSESFTSLSRVTSIEDLVKKVTPYRRKLKASKSCGTGLNSFKSYALPKATISKKAAKGSSSSFPFKRGSNCMRHNGLPPTPDPLRKNVECIRRASAEQA